LGAARVRAAAERVPGGRKGVRMLAWSLEGIGEQFHEILGEGGEIS
jgi:hypothetical protein